MTTDIFRLMLLLRRFEEVLAQHYLDHKVFSFVHFYTGSEASAVGVCNNLSVTDKVFGNHRSHGHYLAKGGCPYKLAAEMLGKSSGCAGGFGGSMHPVSRETGFMGTSPILGSSIPLSVGASFAEKLQKTGNIAVGFTGDGASEEGLCIEAINLAAAWELPHITVIENNSWSVLTPVDKRRSKTRSNKSFYEGLGVIYLQADGTSFDSVNDAASLATNYARDCKPVVLEVFTHRFLAHSTPLFDHHQGHRVNDSKEIMDLADCLNKAAKSLSSEEVDSIRAEVEETMTRVMDFATNSCEPSSTNLLKYIYA